MSSRPLSSATITPQKKRPQTSDQKPSTRQKLHDLFRIPLRSRSTSSSRSRPTTPPQRPLETPPPLPTRSSSETSRPCSPTTPRPLRVTNATPSLVSTAPSLKLPKFFSSRNASTVDHTRSTENNGPSVIPPLVSGPLKRVSSLHRHSLKPINNLDSDPGIPQIPPQITHTPPTPLQSPINTKGPVTSRLGYHALKNSLDSGYRYRGTTMGVVDEEGRVESQSKSSTKDLPPEPRPPSRPPTNTNMTSAVRARKHGSFDFERPGWAASQIQRNGSNGTSGTTASDWTDSIHNKERDSTYGPGLAGVGTLQRDASMRRGREREEKIRLRDLARKQSVPPNRDHLPMTRATPSEHLHPSTSTTGKSNTGTEKSTPTTGKSSSMSKASAKRAPKTASGSGVARFVGLGTQHGPFSFEPPVPSPNRSTGSTGTSHEVQVSWSKTEKERLRLRDEKERQQSKDKKNPKRGDRPAVPVPMLPTNAGHRSGTKGRSLDLGLGLAWAPSKVREEALLPSATFFTRSLSNSSSNRSRSGSTATGKSVSSSTTGNGSGRSKGGVMDYGSLDPDVQRSKLGKEVAELFKHAVDPEGYAAFRNYVHQFDAHEIPFDGPTGIVTRVEQLLDSAPGLADEAKHRLLDKFIRIILQQA